MGQIKDDGTIEEYQALRRHIEQQFALIIQVFTLSIITCVTVWGFSLPLKEQSVVDVNVITTVFPLLAFFVFIPIAYLLLSLREEIFDWASYIRIFIEPRKKGFNFETAIRKYRARPEYRSSFNRIAVVYDFFYLATALMWIYQIFPLWLALDYSKHLGATLLGVII